MSDDHAKRVAEIEAVTNDYVEVFEPPTYCEPALKAVGEVISGGVNFFAGGITWVDDSHDERFGFTGLRPFT